MTLHIIVPVKCLDQAKSRLAEVLSTDERRALAMDLLTGVLRVVRQAQAQLPAHGIVISADSDVLELAATCGIAPLPELPSSQLPGPDSQSELPLNAALEQATAWAGEQGASAVLILPADLPLLTLGDVRDIWRASQQLYSARAMVIAPDGRGTGTNALLMRPPGVLRYQFGPYSFQRHCDQARRLGIAWHVLRSERLGLDVDLPGDLVDLRWHLAVEQADVALSQDEHARLAAREGERAMAARASSSTKASMLTIDEVVAFLQQPDLLMRLGTVGADGYPQVTPVWYLAEKGVFYITTAADRVKTANMLANPKVGFAIDSDVKPYRGLSVWGRALLVAEGEDARPLTRRIAARYVPAQRLDAMVETLMLAPRVVFAIEPLRAARMGSWDVVGSLPYGEEEQP